MEKAKVKDSDVSVAAVNGPKMTVISGRKEVVDKAGKPRDVAGLGYPGISSSGDWHDLRACQAACPSGRKKMENDGK